MHHLIHANHTNLVSGIEPVEPVLKLHHLTDHNMLLSDEAETNIGRSLTNKSGICFLQTLKITQQRAEQNRRVQKGKGRERQLVLSVSQRR